MPTPRKASQTSSRRQTSAARANGSQRRASAVRANDSQRQMSAGRANGSLRRAKAVISQWRMYGVVACAAVMVVGCLVGMAFFARPTTSAVENRNLTQYPEFALSSFMDGSYFTQASLWYADTYPLREPMVRASLAMKAIYGVAPKAGLVGGNVQADEIPVEPDAGASSSQGVEVPQAVKPTEQIEVPDQFAVAEAVQNSIMDGLYIKDGAAFAMYYFWQDGADLYIASANLAAQQLDGVSHVYSLLVPASSIVLPDEEYDEVGGSNQRQVLDYVWQRLDDGVTHVDLFETMKAHRDEYLFFRTDHHWTMLGAYYGYVEYCKARGTEPKPLSTFAYSDYGAFNGSYYDTIAQMMTPNTDDFQAYTPPSTNTLEFHDSDGTDGQAPIVADSSNWGDLGKYDSLIDSDHPNQVIKNPNLDDGSSCLVVKDSYGCAFVPFLVEDYQTVHVLDPRYYEGNVCDYAREHNIQDVVFVYGIKVGLAEKYADLLYLSIAGQN